MGLLKAIIYFTISYFLANLIIANIEILQRNPYIGPYLRYLNIERLILIVLFLLLVVF
jgi:hypothetical protein